MKTTLIAGLLLALTVWVAPLTLAADEAASPKIVAAKFHADWCGSCKKMGPVFEDLRNKFDGEPILFVTYDRTNLTSRGQAELLAAALGQSKIYSENAGTGFILLVNPANGEIVGRLSSTESIKEMGAKLKGLL